MVNLDIPSRYTFSPSEGTPHLTINRDATIDLDSSNAFEGPEKLLEVWFAPTPNGLPAGTKNVGLKAVAEETWKEMLDQVHCKVLSVVRSDHVDAYLLSESSMFVFPHKLILKTCGTTTLLLGLRRILRLAAVDAGFPSHHNKSLEDIKTAATPYRLFYSRKNFLFPEKQQGPHRSWKDEVKFLDDMFTGGSAYMVGKMNGDHWYLYLTTPNMMFTPPRTPDGDRAETETKLLNVPGSAGSYPDQPASPLDDETLEILMTDLDPENAKQFYEEHASAVAQGRFSERAQEAREEASNSLGHLTGTSMGNSTSSDLTGTTSLSGNDAFDVFSHTSSDNEVFTPPDDACCLDEGTEGHALGTLVSETCGLSEVYPISKYPDARIDAYLFSPCGFSANGVIPASGRAGSTTHYFTVHVTPEPQCSYASFETNVPGCQNGHDTVKTIERMVNIFKPGRFSVTLFEAKPDLSEVRDLGRHDGAVEETKAGLRRLRNAKMDQIPGYKRIDRVVHDFDGYDLVFRFYEREDWKGGVAARVGEVD